MVSSEDIDQLWDYSNPQESEKKFLTLRDELINNHDIEGIKQVKTQIARALGLQQKFKEGHSVLNEIEYSAASSLTKVRYHLERGRLYNSNNEKNKALTEFQKAWEIATETGEPFYAVDAAHMIAIVSSETQQQLSWNRTAIAHAENSKDDRAKKWLGSLLNNTGWSYFENKQYDEALEMFRKALKFREKHGNENSIRIAKWCIGKVYRFLDQIEDALEIMHDLEREFKEKGLDVGGYTLEELGELYLIKGDEQSKMYFGMAYEALSQDIWLQKNEKLRLDRMKELSQ